MRRSILLVFVCCATACRPASSEEPVKTRAEIIAGVGELEAFIRDQMARHKVEKVSVAIVSENELVYANGFGADVTETFWAASISKVAGAYAAMQLVERGQLRLDEPLESYLPAPYIPNRALGSKITLRHVLTHTSGLRNEATGEDRTIYYAPGTVFHYGSGNFKYLTVVLEAVLGTTLDQHMERVVLPQLGMKDSVYRLPGDQGIPEELRVNAAYSMVTTPSDVARLFMELLEPRHADVALIATMRTPAVKVTSRYAWGLGVGVQTGTNEQAIWHWGDVDEYQNLAVFFERSRTGVVVMTRARGGAGKEIYVDIARQAIGGEHYGYASGGLPQGFGW